MVTKIKIEKVTVSMIFHVVYKSDKNKDCLGTCSLVMFTTSWLFVSLVLISLASCQPYVEQVMALFL